MSDMSKSFAYLQDNIPKWLQDIARIEDKIAAMQDRITTVAVSRSPFAKSTPGSADSLRTPNMDVIAEEVKTDVVEDSKTRAPSVLSGRLSAPSRYRPRTMVVVSYDGDTQKSLELLVQAIGIGRNLLRKARMESKMNQLAALAGSSDEDEDEDEDDRGNSEEEELVPRSSRRPRMSSMRARAAARTSGRLGVTNGTDTPIALFEATDKTLEHTQGLCEKAAHLTLREGDCRRELAQVRTSFEDVLRTADTEIVKCNAHRSHDTPELQRNDTSDTSISSLETPCKDNDLPMPMTTLALEPQAKIPQLAGLTPTPPEPNRYDMEVDEDDDDDDFDLIMPPVRLTSRMHARA